MQQETVVFYTNPSKNNWALWICAGLAIYCLLFFLCNFQNPETRHTRDMGRALVGILTWIPVACYFLYLRLQKPYKKLIIDKSGVYVFKRKQPSVCAFLPWEAIKSLPSNKEVSKWYLCYKASRFLGYSLSVQLSFWEKRKALKKQRDELSRKFFQSCVPSGTHFRIPVWELDVTPKRLLQILRTYLEHYRQQHPQ